MPLQITKNRYRQHLPPPAPRIFPVKIEQVEGAQIPTVSARRPLDLPILATANDLREVVKFFRHKTHGVSVIELTNAEPRRVFDARKIAAYEFWGILERAEDRLQLTPLGVELAANTEAECAIHRRILRSIAPYMKAVEWIYLQNSKIATFFDVAGFWESDGGEFCLSAASAENLEAVVVSFFSLCHAAELGTATVGKRGQPARLTLNFDSLKAFLRSEPSAPVRTVGRPEPFAVQNEQLRPEHLGRVYISAAGRRREDLEDLCTAFELADLGAEVFGGEEFENALLPASRLAVMKQCQASVFILDETDCTAQTGFDGLRCDRVTEISVAQALAPGRVVVLWTGRAEPPEVLDAAGLSVLTAESLDWETNVRLVKCLKDLRRG